MNRVKIFFKALFFLCAFSVALLLLFLFLTLIFMEPGPLPPPSPKVYVSEEPFSYFAYNPKSGLNSGIIEYDGKEQEFIMYDDGEGLVFYKLSHFAHMHNYRENDATTCADELLFRGYRYDAKNEAVIDIILDNTGLFSGDNKEIHFTAYDKDDYIEKQGPLKLIE